MGPSRDVWDQLARLRAIPADRATAEDYGAHVSRLTESVERICTENDGMAEELLCTYEQLGIVFDITRRLPTVHGEGEVVDLFVDTLRGSFDSRDVFVVYPHQLAKCPNEGGEPSLRAWLEHLCERTRDQRRVLVEPAPSHGLPDIVPNVVSEALVGPVFAGDSFVCAIATTRGQTAEAFRAVDMLLLESLTVFCGDLIRNHRLVQEVREMSITVVRSLVDAVDQKDQYTSGHSFRVGYFASLLGEALGLEETDLRMLQWGALLHDVGKIGIRDDVLKKTGKLTKEEFDHIKEHPVRSHKVVRGVAQLARALDGVLHHHEHYDGSGYPDGLCGEKIPLQARIIQIADVFDALTSTRSYRQAYGWQDALEILRQEAGRTVDPKLQAIFDRIIRGTLGDDPANWQRMLERANSFARTSDHDWCSAHEE